MAKRWKTCLDLRANLISTKVSASHYKSTQVHASPGQTDASRPKFSTCVYLRVCLARALERGLYILISTLGLRPPKSHALRTKDIHCVLCFGAFTFSERITLLRSPALGLPRARTVFTNSAIGLLRFENEEYSSCFALWNIYDFRTKNMHCL